MNRCVNEWGNQWIQEWINQCFSDIFEASAILPFVTRLIACLVQSIDTSLCSALLSVAKWINCSSSRERRFYLLGCSCLICWDWSDISWVPHLYTVVFGIDNALDISIYVIPFGRALKICSWICSFLSGWRKEKEILKFILVKSRAKDSNLMETKLDFYIHKT